MTAIEIENLSKQYAIGKIGSGSLYRDLNVWWARMRGRPNPYQKIGQVNDRTQKADGDYVWALQDINLKIEEGDVVGIIGSNGAGKSTLLKILSRVTTPTTGRITTYGRIASLLEVGTGFHGEMTGRENIYMNGAIMGMSRAEITRKLDEIVDFAGVEKYIDTPVKRYSSGMTVRLGFAVAAFLEPEILIVDEVLAVGDADFQKKAISKMQDVSKGQGRTVLFVSHNMAAVKRLCNTGVLLKNGILADIGNVHSIVDSYLAPNQWKDVNVFHPENSKRKTSCHGVVLNNLVLKNDLPKTGDTISFFFEVDNKNVVSKEVEIAIFMNNKEGTHILQYFSKDMNARIVLKPGRNIVNLEIPDFPLVEGLYSTGVWIGSSHIYLDWIIDCFMLKVGIGSFNGSVIENRGVPVLTMCKWH